jgi:hypothetical protein
VQGLLTSRNVPIYNGGTAAGDKAVQMFKALNSMRGSALLEPEWIAIHPTDYQHTRLLTDTARQFFGGGPFMGAYGNTMMATRRTGSRASWTRFGQAGLCHGRNR